MAKPDDRKYDAGDTIEYKLDGMKRKRKAEIRGVRYSEHPDNPGHRYDFEYIIDAEKYLGDAETDHVVPEDKILGRA